MKCTSLGLVRMLPGGVGEPIEGMMTRPGRRTVRLPGNPVQHSLPMAASEAFACARWRLREIRTMMSPLTEPDRLYGASLAILIYDRLETGQEEL
jgi:hypothetical protein